MKKICSAAILLALLTQLSEATTDRLTRINEDFTSGAITKIQHIEFNLYYYFAPENLPSAYQNMPAATINTKCLF